MENTFILIFFLFKECVCLLIAEHEVAERKVAKRDCFFFFMKLLVFLLVSF